MTYIQDLNPKKIDTNFNGWKKFDTDREATDLPQLINAGSCCLHIIYDVFKSRVAATLWKIKKVLKHLHCLFDHTSARRDDYVNETGSTTLIVL